MKFEKKEFQILIFINRLLQAWIRRLCVERGDVDSCYSAAVASALSEPCQALV